MNYNCLDIWTGTLRQTSSSVDANKGTPIQTPQTYREYDTHRAISLMDGLFPYMSSPTR
jgi:hypothetical protein